jgi:Tol biopolymer transport system component
MNKTNNARAWIALVLGAACLLAVAFFSSKKAQPLPVISLPEPEKIQVEKVVSIADTNFYPQRPIWSPDGKQIAFARMKSDGIEVMNSDGTNRRVLTTDPNSGYKLAWSPDSTEIAYRYNDVQNSIYKIKKVNVATGKDEVLHEQNEELHTPEWVWSEKGKRITFVSVPGNKRFSTAWQKSDGVLPTGKKNTDKILYFDQDNIWIMNEDSSEKKQLSFDIGFDPIWSPDRTRIIYSQLDTLILIDPDGGNKVVLGYGNHPSWSPDGKKIVFQVTQDHTHATDDNRQHGEDTTMHRHDDKTNHRIVESDLYVINADGTKRTRLTNTPGKVEVDPSWSPDGRRIVYRLEDTGEIQVAHLKW